MWANDAQVNQGGEGVSIRKKVLILSMDAKVKGPRSKKRWKLKEGRGKQTKEGGRRRR